MSKLFSIVIPVHNREKYIKDTLRSVVGQDYRPLQLILVDNNSTDNSMQLAKQYLSSYESADFKVICTQEKKKGACAARNKGVTLSEAPYMMFLDDDDMLSTFTAISKIVERFEQSGADVVGFKAYHYYSYKKKRIRHYSFINDIKEQVLHCMLSTQCYAIRREFYDTTRGWDERIMRWQDWNLGIRIMLLNPKIEWIEDKPLVNIRVHSKSITGNGYLHSAEHLYQTIMLTVESVQNSNVENKKEIVSAIYARLPILAAHYLREGGIDTSRQTLKLYNSKVQLSIWQKIVVNLLYLYTALGGRGAGRVLNKLKIELKEIDEK
ncbi:MAG: glycosyltransferase family 2 protein [Bacteroidales bacterium]|nr:glycosyltransferase family 2 protein [Bacteroidales bacterium]